MSTSSHLGFRAHEQAAAAGLRPTGTHAHAAAPVPRYRRDLGFSSAQAFVFPFEPGEIVAEKYCVQQLIGVGGVGFVVAARHLGLDDDVALKFLKPEFASYQEAVQCFTREARASFRIKNEHVARVLDVNVLPNGVPFMVMDLLEGQDMRRMLAQHGRLPVDLAVDFALQSCEALAAAHACQIVHRDIKPENLFVTQSGENDLIKVLDFGISKIAHASDTAQADAALTMAAVGTPPYMPPEQIRGSPNLDARADIWSLGCVLYELLTGVAPFARMSLMQACAAVLEDDPPPLRERCSGLPRSLEEAITCCLRKRSDERFLDVAELARALAPFGRRYVHCAERCADLLAEGMRRSGAGARASDSAALLSSNPHSPRLPTQTRLPAHTRQPLPNLSDAQADASSPQVRRPTRHPLSTPMNLPVLTPSSVARPPASSPPPPPPPRAVKTRHGGASADIDLDSMPGLRPRKTRWLLLAVSALMVAGAVFLHVLETNPWARVRKQLSSHVAPGEPARAVAEKPSAGEDVRAALSEASATSSAP